MTKPVIKVHRHNREWNLLQHVYQKEIFRIQFWQFPNHFNIVQFPILCSDNNFIHQDHLRREGKEGRKKKEGRDDVLQNRQVQTCAVMKHTLIYARKPKAPMLLISCFLFTEPLGPLPKLPFSWNLSFGPYAYTLSCDCKYQHDVLSTTTRVQMPGVLPRKDVVAVRMKTWMPRPSHRPNPKTMERGEDVWGRARRWCKEKPKKINIM